jgi:hypothetical protein
MYECDESLPFDCLPRPHEPPDTLVISADGLLERQRSDSTRRGVSFDRGRIVRGEPWRLVDSHGDRHLLEVGRTPATTQAWVVYPEPNGVLHLIVVTGDETCRKSAMALPERLRERTIRAAVRFSASLPERSLTTCGSSLTESATLRITVKPDGVAQAFLVEGDASTAAVSCYLERVPRTPFPHSRLGGEAVVRLGS